MTQEDPRILELRKVRAKAKEGGGEERNAGGEEEDGAHGRLSQCSIGYFCNLRDKSYAS